MVPQVVPQKLGLPGGNSAYLGAGGGLGQVLGQIGRIW